MIEYRQLPPPRIDRPDLIWLNDQRCDYHRAPNNEPIHSSHRKRDDARKPRVPRDGSRRAATKQTNEPTCEYVNTPHNKSKQSNRCYLYRVFDCRVEDHLLATPVLQIAREAETAVEKREKRARQECEKRRSTKRSNAVKQKNIITARAAGFTTLNDVVVVFAGAAYAWSRLHFAGRWPNINTAKPIRIMLNAARKSFYENKSVSISKSNKAGARPHVLCFQTVDEGRDRADSS